MTDLAWGAHVSAAFRSRVQEIAAGLSPDPDCASWLMSAMAFETGQTFSPAIRNAAGSGAVGLIQFMPQTAASLGTTVADLGAMSAEAQLECVAEYFRPWTGRLHNVGDLYGAVIWPAMIGKPDSYVCFDKADPDHPKRYLQNIGLDTNRDGKTTRGETYARVLHLLQVGLQPPNVWTDGLAFAADLTRKALEV
jgi:hypothetical protein